jgi:hypothetical protein
MRLVRPVGQQAGLLIGVQVGSKLVLHFCPHVTP